jgi:hypothetical protein
MACIITCCSCGNQDIAPVNENVLNGINRVGNGTTNQAANLGLTPNDLPDLVIQNIISKTDTIRIGESLTLDIITSNTGNKDIPGAYITVDFFLSLDSIISLGDINLGRRIVGTSLAKGQTLSSTQVFGNLYTVRHSYNVLCRLDPANLIRETSVPNGEGNNTNEQGPIPQVIIQ